jgi:hypothetical protein
MKQRRTETENPKYTFGVIIEYFECQGVSF